MKKVAKRRRRVVKRNVGDKTEVMQMVLADVLVGAHGVVNPLSSLRFGMSTPFLYQVCHSGFS